MENIQRFQAAVKNYGVPQEEIFQTADLFERRNIAQVRIYEITKYLSFKTSPIQLKILDEGVVVFKVVLN